jgi:hypothetical protein
MGKKIINIDEIPCGLPALYEIIYHNLINGNDPTLSHVDFIKDEKPFDMSIWLENVNLLLQDRRWEWNPNRTPYDFFDKVPFDRKWIHVLDLGHHWRVASNRRMALRKPDQWSGHPDYLMLTAAYEHHGMGKASLHENEIQRHLVVAFDTDDDYIFYKMKHS